MPESLKDLPGPSPHGGSLELRAASEEQAGELLGQAASLPRIEIRSSRVLSDLELFAAGALSPNRGFMTRDDYESVIENMRLSSGLIWSLPVTLPASEDEAKALASAESAALFTTGKAVAVIRVEDVFPADPRREALKVYGTEDDSHPGVAYLYSQPPWYVGGEIVVIGNPSPGEFPDYRLTPLQLRQRIEERGWRNTVAFQTRNPIHRAHEYLTKVALELVDGLVVHPLVGATKEDDIPANIRMACYQTLLEHYYPQERVLLAVFPAAMRYAGPREAIWHALLRKNYGMTHFIVGRDHAGVGNYYGTYAAQEIFEGLEEELGITILKFEHSFFCRACGSMASGKTCPHGAEQRVHLSGTEVRRLLAQGIAPPPEFTRPEVARILLQATTAKEDEA